MKIVMKIWYFVAGLILIVNGVYSQNSQANGNWTSGSTWNGGSAPPTSGGWVTVNVNHNITLTGTYSLGGTLNVQSGGSLTITGNTTVTGGSTINVYGTLNLNSDITLNSNLRIYPGGSVIIDGSITIVNSNYLTVGTNVAAPPYADLVVRQNVIQSNSGDITVNRNGRFAVMGDISRSGGGGGLILSISNGGQVYVGGNIDYGTAGGGNNQIQNSNSANPYGLYVGGSIINTTGGSGTTPNNANEQVMYNTNLPFYNWVTSYFGPLPVSLLYINSKALDTGISINWATVTEENADYFIIERSSNGIGFTSIGKESASGNSKDLIRYAFADERPLEGKNYYRLKTVDYDGSFEYSKIISANWDTPKVVNVYPNPSSGASISFKTNFSPQENDRIIVLNSVGNEVAKIDATGFDSEITFNSTLKPGIYFVKYVSSNFEKTIRVSVVN